MFELTDHSIDAAALRARLSRPEAGALIVFEGWVRNHHAGRPVTRLEYEAFDELARLEGEAITTEAEKEHPGSPEPPKGRQTRSKADSLAVSRPPWE